MSVASDCETMKVGAEQLISDESFADEFVCKICQVHVVGCGPKLTKCSHLFCGDCLQEWFVQHPSNQTWAQRAKSCGTVPCPVCKTALDKEKDVYCVGEHENGEGAMLWQMIQGLKVKCDGRGCQHAGGSCSWRGELGAFWEHLRSGTCGAAAPSTESADVMHNADTRPVVIDDVGKALPPSPSTCSQCSPELSEPSEPFSAEDWSHWSLDSEDEKSEDDESLCEHAYPEGFPITMPAVASEQDDSPCEHADSDFFPVAMPAGASEQQSSSLTITCVDTESELSESPPVLPDRSQKEHAPACKPASRSKGKTSTAPKNAKSKAKKASASEPLKAPYVAQDWVQAARRWQAMQAYQSQMAQYQMAYAHQYQMNQMAYAQQYQRALEYQQQRAAQAGRAR